jgi:hypothetical protein
MFQLGARFLLKEQYQPVFSYDFFPINKLFLGIFEILNFKKVSKRTYNSGSLAIAFAIVSSKIVMWFG